MKDKTISVIIPTYNPDRNRLEKVILSLTQQTLDKSFWELIIIDNNSTNDTLENFTHNNFPDFRIIEESKQGLTWARLKGFSESRGDIIIMVDDDNMLDHRYLEVVLEEFTRNPKLGAIGGKSIGQFEIPNLPSYFNEVKNMLAIRDLGDSDIYFELPKENSLTFYPPHSPIGAGMGIRKAALANYLRETANNPSMISDRRGTNLSSGGDNDIVLSILKSGYGVLYSPRLSLIHIIPAFRLNPTYLAKLNRDSSKSWVEVLSKYGISPWTSIPKWTVAFRKLRSYFRLKAWQNDIQYIRWRGACGVFEGRSAIR